MRPTYQAQFLPLTTKTLSVDVVDTASSSLATVTVERKVGATSATASLEFLPAGLVYFVVKAKDAGGIVVASGTQAATLSANKRNAVKLALVAANAPVITLFSPRAGGPGLQVDLFGLNLPGSASTFSLRVGGVTVPAIQTASYGTTQFSFFVPSGATTDAIVLTVDGSPAITQAAFTTVGSLTIFPSAGQTLSKNATLSLLASALDTTVSSPQAVANAPLSFSLSNLVGVNTEGAASTPGTGTPLGSFSPGTVLTASTGLASTTFTALATGSGWINVKCGTVLRATVSMQVN